MAEESNGHAPSEFDADGNVRVRAPHPLYPGPDPTQGRGDLPVRETDGGAPDGVVLRRIERKLDTLLAIEFERSMLVLAAGNPHKGDLRGYRRARDAASRIVRDVMNLYHGHLD